MGSIELPPSLLEARFDGQILARGFWLYVWKIVSPNRVLLYVGRTGDSSSPNAASPFSRLSAHLQSKETAKGNSMHRRLLAEGVDPTTATFQMAAAGPLLPEQSSFVAHCPYRDRMAAMECELANRLGRTGWDVVGTHGTVHRLEPRDMSAFSKVYAMILEALGDP